MHLIPIPDQFFVMLTTLVLGLGSFTIANVIHLRWLSSQRLSILYSNMIVDSVIVSFGFLVIPISGLFNGDIATLPVDTLFAGLLAAILITCERQIIRRYYRTHQHAHRVPSSHNKSELTVSSIKPTRVSLTSKKPEQRRVSGLRRNSHAMLEHSALYQLTMSGVIIVAILEEILFRGQLQWLVTQSGVALFYQVVAIILISFIFGLSHLMLGAPQFIAKTIMGLLLAGIVFITGHLITVILAHTFHNIIALKEQRTRQQMFVLQTG